MQTLFIVLGFLILCTSIFPLLRSHAWFIRGFDFPRLQVTLFVLIYLVFLCLFFHAGMIKWALLGLCLFSLSFDFYRIGPYFSIFPTESKQSDKVGVPHLKVFSSNVFVNNTNYSQLLTSVEKVDPDIVLLLEPDMNWQEGVEKLQSKYPHFKLVPLDNTYGMLFYSKFEMLSTVVKYQIDDKVPSIFTKVKIPNAGEVELICVHPRPPRPNESSSLQRDAELISVANYVAKKSHLPILVFGDLNDVAWSHTTRLFKRMSSTLDPRIGRGFFNTFPVKSRCLRVPLDHIFHTASLGIRSIKVLPSIGSDHFPITASFDILPDNKSGGKPSKLDSADIEESKEIKHKGNNYDGPTQEVSKEDE